MTTPAEHALAIRVGVVLGKRTRRRFRWAGRNAGGAVTFGSLPIFRRVCAYCGRDLGALPLGATAGDSHGACPSCERALLADLEER